MGGRPGLVGKPGQSQRSDHAISVQSCEYRRVLERFECYCSREQLTEQSGHGTHRVEERLLCGRQLRDEFVPDRVIWVGVLAVKEDMSSRSLPVRGAD